MVGLTHTQLGADSEFFALGLAGLVGTLLHAIRERGWRSLWTREIAPPVIIGGIGGVLWPRILGSIPFFTTIGAWDPMERAALVLVLSFATSDVTLNVVRRWVLRKGTEIAPVDAKVPAVDTTR